MLRPPSLARRFAFACASLAALVAAPTFVADGIALGPQAALAQTAEPRATPPNPVPRPGGSPAQTLGDAGALGTQAPGEAPAFEAPVTDPLNPDPLANATAAIAAALDPASSALDSVPTFEVVTPDLDATAVPIGFTARLEEDGRDLDRDLVWTVYALDDEVMDEDDLILSAQGGALRSQLPPGSYIVHVSYGMATLARPLTVGPQGLEERFVFNAGGIALRAAIAQDQFLPNDAVRFEVFPETENDLDNGRPIVRDVDERSVLVVPAGRYTVVSRYGDINAIVRAQIDVEPGQLTEAVMFHKAAQITLKLVNEPNGEALPNTAWSVLNPGGDVVSESVGAFPTMVLSEGDYTIVARYEGQVFSRNFAVIAGVDREEELVAQ